MRINLDFTDKEIGIIRDAIYNFAKSSACCYDTDATLTLLEDINECIEVEEQDRDLIKRRMNLDRKREGLVPLGFGYSDSFSVPVNKKDGEPV